MRPFNAEPDNSPAPNRSILIIDDEDAFTASLGRSLNSLGFEVSLSGDFPTATVMAEKDKPYLVVTELRVAGQWAFSAIDELKRSSPGSRVAIVTTYPSVATAVRSVHMGFCAYVAKPVEPRTLLELTDALPPSAGDAQSVSCDWPSLDRTIWEYINQVFIAAGSMSEAARRLRLDRRSLRRMLAKYPPVQ